jgi:hypothetical protein
MADDNLPDIICDVHNDITENTEECLDLIKQSWDFPMREEVEFRLLKILKLAEEALNMGQSMENRLKDYKKAIETLGFKKNDE